MADETKPRGLDMPSNPIAVIQDPRVISTAIGVLAAHMTRKALYTSYRDKFGIADKVPGEGIVYYAPKKDAQGNVVADTTRRVPDAQANRLLVSAGQVLIGTVLMGQSKELAVDYLALGFAASGFANIVSALLSIE
ncbi:hypothetical protein [Calidithermus chliarophilus]|uniref:hypothetical protein n=1 Tax=Calidithermus chliarophilus TaxID=52023 RepID=UPI0004097B4A|nr:hypothetical protein [Calidithermus chliarophilus]